MFTALPAQPAHAKDCAMPSEDVPPRATGFNTTLSRTYRVQDQATGCVVLLDLGRAGLMLKVY